jgi:hypothetical protein
VLTAHIAKRGHFEVEENLNLPLPLDRYFAGSKAHACMRCHLDRPGRRPALERSDPHPFTYICAACHDEVYGDFSADLADKISALTERDRESLIIEKALSRPSTLKAEKEVLAKMSGIPPDMPVPPVAPLTRGSFSKTSFTRLRTAPTSIPMRSMTPETMPSG